MVSRIRSEGFRGEKPVDVMSTKCWSTGYQHSLIGFGHLQSHRSISWCQPRTVSIQGGIADEAYSQLVPVLLAAQPTRSRRQ